MNHYTSDLHLFHKNIVKFTNRPDMNVEDHIEWIITLWNSQVKPGDTVYHLGDFCFAGTSKLQEMLSITQRLNGNIVFLIGNHDSENMLNQIAALRTKGKTEVCHYKEIRIGGVRTILNHYCYYVWNQCFRGSYHLFGHSHGSLEHPGKALDVGLDNSYNLFGEHRFFRDEDITKYMETKPVFSPDHHNVRD